MVLLHRHYVLEVEIQFYRDMLIYIWKVIKIVGEAPWGMFLLWVEHNKLDFKTTEGYCTFINRRRICCCYRG